MQAKKDKANQPVETIQPEKNWNIKSNEDWLKGEGLLNVESVVYDQANQVFYASNGKNYEAGTDGYISKISKDGTLHELKWISLLNRPTGMAIFDSILYVADFNALVEINTNTGRIINKYKEPIINSGLNDVSVNKKGEVYITASFVHSVFKLGNGKLEIWLNDEENMKWANGIIADDKQIIVAGLNINSIDIASKKITNINLNPTVSDFDGIISDGGNGYFLTTVENSGLFHLNQQYNTTQIMEGEAYFGDLEFDKNQNKLFIPRGNKEADEFYISVIMLE